MQKNIFCTAFTVAVFFDFVIVEMKCMASLNATRLLVNNYIKQHIAAADVNRLKAITIIQYNIRRNVKTCNQLGKITIKVKIKNYIQLNKGWLMC